ncbi:phospholipase D-like domain-containing protein [Sedimentitalea sp. HM32M-2]|uniref:phospholipase D-like domain-containing protein n=1 Tax=Sedimentitalea sp. HM32M-2 TaxID=3351566 RepID=UPI0036361A21
MTAPAPSQSDPDDLQILLTAHEAYPEFERLFLAARREVSMGFRIFDPATRLRSPEARRIGETWLDLIQHGLRRGLRVTLVLTDFDPVAVPHDHRDSWASIRALIAAGELSGHPGHLRVRAAMHPARVGLGPRCLLWPRAWLELRATARDLNRLTPDQRHQFLREAPRLRPYLQERRGRLRARLWPIPQLAPATHHQKLAVFDRNTVYIGGLDLNERRYDTQRHDQEAAQTWHDVQLILRGTVAEQAALHLDTFEATAHGHPPPDLSQLLRTISRRRRWAAPFISPRPFLTELAAAHVRLAGDARRLIYLETQYFRDRHLARHLARQARAEPGLGLILILPAAPEEVAFADAPGSESRFGEYLQARCLRIIRRAFGARLFVGAPAQPRAYDTGDRTSLFGAPIVYLHSKVSIFDDRAAIVSSANLNGRSLYWDTEAGVLLTRPAQIVRLKRRCFAHWLGPDAPDAFFAPATAVQAWRQRALQNAARPPVRRSGFILPYVTRPAWRFGRNLPGVPEEMV